MMDQFLPQALGLLLIMDQLLPPALGLLLIMDQFLPLDLSLCGGVCQLYPARLWKQED